LITHGVAGLNFTRRSKISGGGHHAHGNKVRKAIATVMQAPDANRMPAIKASFGSKRAICGTLAAEVALSGSRGGANEKDVFLMRVFDRSFWPARLV
jgi:hypothetical protein